MTVKRSINAITAVSGTMSRGTPIALVRKALREIQQKAKADGVEDVHLLNTANEANGGSGDIMCSCMSARAGAVVHFTLAASTLPTTVPSNITWEDVASSDTMTMLISAGYIKPIAASEAEAMFSMPGADAEYDRLQSRMGRSNETITKEGPAAIKRMQIPIPLTGEPASNAEHISPISALVNVYLANPRIMHAEQLTSAIVGLCSTLTSADKAALDLLPAALAKNIKAVLQV